MVRLEDLWYGDEVELIKSGRKGTYAGKTEKKKVRVEVEGKIILTSISNLQVPHKKKDISEEEKEKTTNNFSSVPIPKEIDLHMEKLATDVQGMRPERIHDFQISACRNFIENAIDRKLPFIKIIHGKGTGNLKASVMHLLSLYDEVHIHTPAHAGGATDVWLVYK